MLRSDRISCCCFQRALQRIVEVQLSSELNMASNQKYNILAFSIQLTGLGFTATRFRPAQHNISIRPQEETEEEVKEGGRDR